MNKHTKKTYPLEIQPETMPEMLITLAAVHPGIIDGLYALVFNVPMHHFEGLLLEKKIRHIMKAVDRGDNLALDRLEGAIAEFQKYIGASHQ
jgi:hypothetical protein